MTNIMSSGNAHWQTATFSPPDDNTFAWILKKLTYCWDTNTVLWVEGEKPYNSSRDGLPGTTRNDGYRYVKLGKHLIPVSRIAYFFIHGTWPAGVVRFADGDKTNFKPDNLLDTGDRQNPLTHSALMRIAEGNQAKRQEVFEKARAANQAADGLHFIKYYYKTKLDDEIERLKFAKFGHLKYTTKEENEEFRAAAVANVEKRELPRDAVDYELKRMGIEPPADIATAFKLLETLS